MTDRIARIARSLALLALLGALAGCVPELRPPDFHAFVDPPTGHVPYEARIVCTPRSGTYTYEFPDGSVVTQAENELGVVVDDISWEATVTWTNGTQVLSAVAAARGTNAAPRILRPRIAGQADRWYFRPRERTLIDFTHHEASVSGAETGVVYDEAWRIVEIRVECELKTFCGVPVPDSIFCPPYEPDVYQAEVRGWLVSNACVVYPTYTGDLAPDGLPYAPAAEDGYVYDTHRVRNLYYGVAFPPQTAWIHVTVEDAWGRRTGAAFEIPVSELIWKNSDATDPDEVLFYVAGRNSAFYCRSDCPQACAIPVQDRLYFRDPGSAEASGRRPDPRCP